MKFVAANATGDPAELLPDDVTEPVVAVCARGEASDEVAGMLRERGVEPRTGGEEAIANMRAIDALYESADRGAPVEP